MTIPPGADARRTRRTRYPVAAASLYQPVAGRSWWWLSIRCPKCCGVHLGRVRDEAEARGARRTTCGVFWVIVRRTYRSGVTA